MCAGKPLIGKLTENVLQNADDKLKKHFGSLKASGDRPATIEDLINFLVRYRDILYTITSVDGHSLSIDEIDGWLTGLKKKIVYPDSLRKRKYLAKSFRKDSCCRHDLRGIFEHDGTGRADRVGSERLGRASSGSTRQRACTAGPGNELLGCRSGPFS